MKSVAATQMNANSSRAHTVFKLKMERRDGTAVVASEVFFVDLAGRENEKTTRVTGDRFIELSFINKSLMWLSWKAGRQLRVLGLLKWGKCHAGIVRCASRVLRFFEFFTSWMLFQKPQRLQSSRLFSNGGHTGTDCFGCAEFSNCSLYACLVVGGAVLGLIGAGRGALWRLRLHDRYCDRGWLGVIMKHQARQIGTLCRIL